MSAVQDVGLSNEAAGDVQAELGRVAFGKLSALVERFEADDAAGKIFATVVNTATGTEKRFLRWEEVEAAYRSFRCVYVPHRATRKGSKKVRGPDPSLQRWAERGADYVETFFGPLEADGRRHFTGVDVEIASMLKRYQRLQSRWHKRQPEYLVWAKNYQKLYMRRKRKEAQLGKPVQA